VGFTLTGFQEGVVPAYDFRVNFQIASGDRINHDAPEMPILAVQGGPTLLLKALDSQRSIRGARELLLIGGPFPTAEAATEAGQKALAALHVFSLNARFGIDFGQRRRAGSPSTHISKSPGLTIYPAGSLLLTGTDAHLVREVPASRFADQISGVYQDSPAFSDRQALAVELYQASHFEDSPRAKFLTLIVAIEALMKPSPRTQDAREFVELLQQLVRRAALPQEDIESLVGSLKWLKDESKGKTGRTLAKYLLGDRNYGGKTASAFFNQCYGIRSQIVHTGRLDDPNVDLGELASLTGEFVADLLKASLGVLTG
jgi:hypothetical protein